MRTCLGVMFCQWLLCSTVVGDEITTLGRHSCAAAACHGSVVDRGPAWSHAFSKWLVRDPHAGAGQLLYDADSRALVLRLDAAAGESATAYDAVLRDRCVSCHATPTPSDLTGTGRLDPVMLAEGVACDACHGDSDSWLETHVRQDWAGGGDNRTDPTMRDTESIVGRAETCVRCHVGSRTADGMVRDVNHDLIAAGHPPLRFDLLSHHENLPPHWDPSGPGAQTFAESALRVRAVGRAIGLAASAALSSERAADHLRGDHVPWPELADYDCFACHQSISMRQYLLPAEQRSRRRLRVSDGLPLWNAWHTVNQLDLRDRAEVLEKLSPHRGDPALVASAGRSLAARYRRLAGARSIQKYRPQLEVARIRQQIDRAPPDDWHQAATVYLDLEAALRDLRPPVLEGEATNATRNLLSQAKEALRFGSTADDAARSGESSFVLHSPARFDPVRFRQAVLDALRPFGNASGAADRSELVPSPDVTTPP